MDKIKYSCYIPTNQLKVQIDGLTWNKRKIFDKFYNPLYKTLKIKIKINNFE